MRDVFYFIAIIYTGRAIWNRVLSKSSAYPPNIPTSLKRTHALILWFGTICSLFSVGTLFWLIRNPAQLSACLASEKNLIGPPLSGFSAIIYSLAGISLFPVWHGLAFRRRKMLKWLFVLWPITFFSFITMLYPRDADNMNHPILTNMLAMSLPTCMFFAVLIFYSRRKIVSSIFNSG